MHSPLPAESQSSERSQGNGAMISRTYIVIAELTLLCVIIQLCDQ